MADNVRLFIGAPVSMATVRALSDAVDTMRVVAKDAGIQVRWVNPTAYHVTLKFIGWTRPEAVEAIRDTVGRALAGQRKFDIDCRGLGAFPKPQKARVLWAGIDDSAERLSVLAHLIDEATAELGYSKEKRSFHPHVTLGRLKATVDVESVLAADSEQTYSISSIGSVALFESVMKSVGSEYTIRAEWLLESSSKGSKRHTRRVETESREQNQRQEDHGDEQGHHSGQPERPEHQDDG